MVVLLGPLANPIGSSNLTIPMSRLVAPVHQALFLGHGYRFFGPDPGPSHILEYRIESADGEEINDKFPDRDQHWPRLLYHRWFMLSETIYEDRFPLIEEEEFKKILEQLDAEIERVRLSGELPNARRLKAEREQMVLDNNARRKRTEELLGQLARHLLHRHGGEQIELFLRERLIAAPGDVASRVRLNHPRFLSEPKSIGKFTFEELNGLESIE